MSDSAGNPVPFGTETPEQIIGMAEDRKIFKAGFQAGLKRGAEIAMKKMIEYALLGTDTPTVFSPEFKIKAETAEEIQNLIMKEAESE